MQQQEAGSTTGSTTSGSTLFQLPSDTHGALPALEVIADSIYSAAVGHPAPGNGQSDIAVPVKSQLRKLNSAMTALPSSALRKIDAIELVQTRQPFDMNRLWKWVQDAGSYKGSSLCRFFRKDGVPDHKCGATTLCTLNLERPVMLYCIMLQMCFLASDLYTYIYASARTGCELVWLREMPCFLMTSCCISKAWTSLCRLGPCAIGDYNTTHVLCRYSNTQLPVFFVQAA